ncbi:unnamed protein product [Spirodela intermedia]|uniref:Uncharacterized protein n=1 Tax=Spirodela intermedia TaxID=51605 RepID=A0A7I8IG78_SPIIN|nr:unnamed protein product [Spirodela intermedia]CAA6656878.1 unnamed protein product [Spirodela intermedia]
MAMAAPAHLSCRTPSLGLAPSPAHRHVPPLSGTSPEASLSLLVVCGPRTNRGPLVRGRTLSTEAILAVQALKRAAAAGDDAASKVDQVVSKTLVRLIKSDLLAALAELQRQDQWPLALKVFVAMRREIWYSVDYASYAQMIATLARNGMTAEIDDLVTFTGNEAAGIPRGRVLLQDPQQGLEETGEREAADEVDGDYATWCDNGGRTRVSAV